MTTTSALAHKLPATSAPAWAKNYAPGIDWNIEIPSQPAYALLENTVLRFGQKPALTFLGQTYDYKTLGTLVNRAAKGLQAMGVGKGIKVGLFLPNSGYSIVMYYAILRAGGTVVNYNPLYVERDLINQIEDSETDIMVTLDAEALFNKARGLLGQSRLKKIIVCPVKQNMQETTRSLPIPADERNVWFCDLTNNDGAVAAVHINPDDDIAVLQYTGGTTGTPKGAMLTHKNIVANAMQSGRWFHIAQDGQDSMVAVLPFFHVFAMTVVMNMPVLRGWHIFIMPQFDIKETLDLIEKERPSFIAAVPTAYMALASSSLVAGRDFSSLKFCLSGGAPLPGDVKRLFEERSGAALLAEGYGLTEFSPVATCNPISPAARVGSIGLPIPGTLVEIISLEDGVTPLPAGEKGEVCLQGPQMMKGYYKQPAETAAVIKNGRLHTGDVGYMDDEGFICLVDRVKDLILVGGYNVYPRHVEEAIYKHPAVHECIVAGVPDKLRGEVVYAWIKPRDGMALTDNEMRGFLQDKVSPIEMPRKIIVREQPLPKTAVGKLSRKDLLEQEGIKK